MCGSFFLFLMSSWKSHHLSEIWQCFHSNNEVSPLKCWQLESKRTRARGKRNHKSRTFGILLLFKFIQAHCDAPRAASSSTGSMVTVQTSLLWCHPQCNPSLSNFSWQPQNAKCSVEFFTLTLETLKRGLLLAVCDWGVIHTLGHSVPDGGYDWLSPTVPYWNNSRSGKAEMEKRLKSFLADMFHFIQR